MAWPNEDLTQRILLGYLIGFTVEQFRHPGAEIKRSAKPMTVEIEEHLSNNARKPQNEEE
jgi:hypothetical protein